MVIRMFNGREFEAALRCGCKCEFVALSVVVVLVFSLCFA